MRLIVWYDVVVLGKDPLAKRDANQPLTADEAANANNLAHVREWLIQAKAHGLEPVISFEHSRGVKCTIEDDEVVPTPYGETPICHRPNPEEYDAAVKAFREYFDPRKDNPAAPQLSRYPVLRLFTAWNEPNHSSQPTSNHGDRRIRGTADGTGARLAGKYWRKLLLQCREEEQLDPDYGCAVAAGDFIDFANADTKYLTQYLGTALTPGTGRRPHLWAWHAYVAGAPGDKGNLAEERLRNFLARTKTGADYASDGPRVWLTEQGGQINNGSAFINTEQTASDDIWRLTPLVARYPRITRSYYYQLMKNATSEFDSGLFEPNYGIRPNMYCAYARAASPANRFCP